MSKVLFNPGLPLLLQLPKLEQRMPIFVIGWQTELFLLTNLPYVNERPLNLRADDNCIIRFLNNDNAYGFQTSVISVQFFPAPLVFFKYPAEVNKMPFRKSKRFKMSIPAKILNPMTVQKIDATICDISDTGCRLEIKNLPEHIFEPGHRFYLTFNILEKSIESDCVLRNIRNIDESLLLGFEFVNMSPANKDMICSFIEMISKVSGAS
jgi:c-di-GMP-binding flagellar brake protein YcgR